jgi:hypothetical protein
VTRYVFTVEDSHLLPPAGLPAHPSTSSATAFQMAEVAVPRHLFVDILRLIAELRPPPVTSTA